MIGQQDIQADGFEVRRVVETGSWLGRAHQGRGAGREMRAAVLHLAFAGLGAARAETGAFADNPASLGVTRSLGYEPNGEAVFDRQGTAARMLRFAMTREAWEARRRDDIEISGLEPCRPLLGA
jgi:RimJ/RimL family protein N-acetyltransferase